MEVRAKHQFSRPFTRSLHWKLGRKIKNLWLLSGLKGVGVKEIEK